MERIDKVIGNGQGPYNIDVDQARYDDSGTEMHIWAASHYNHDRVMVKLTPEQAEELAGSLTRFAAKGREYQALAQSRAEFDMRQQGEL